MRTGHFPQYIAILFIHKTGEMKGYQRCNREGEGCKEHFESVVWREKFKVWLSRMGITGLLKILEPISIDSTLQALSGCTVAVDGYSW